MLAWYHVAIADLEGRPECVHRAYLDPDDTWNGWACPYFEKAEAERMNEWLPELDDGLDYSADTDAFTTRYDPDAIETFTGTDIDGMHLYPIGYGSWTWSIVEGKPATTQESTDNGEQVGVI